MREQTGGVLSRLVVFKPPENGDECSKPGVSWHGNLSGIHVVTPQISCVSTEAPLESILESISDANVAHLGVYLYPGQLLSQL